MTSAGQVELELQERVVADEECKEAEINTTRAKHIMARARSMGCSIGGCGHITDVEEV